MISRRNLRIKVMQSLYLHQQEQESALTQSKQILTTLVDRCYHLFFFHLWILNQTALNSTFILATRRKKHIQKSEEDFLLNPKLADGKIIQLLKKNPRLSEQIEKAHLDNAVDQDSFQRWFLQIEKSEEYLSFLNEKNSGDAESTFLFRVYKNILLKDETFLQQTEDQFPNWEDDREPVYVSMENLLEKLGAGDDDFLNNFVNEKPVEMEFANELLEKTYLHQEEINELISPLLKNWTTDRVADVDMILLRMSAAEMLFFPQIPVKVSINEYVDIAKKYSTPKSNDFLNGILDKLMHNLKEDGKISKEGRGLKEN